MADAVRPVHELETARLRLRAWTDTDLAPFAALNADPRVMLHFPAPLDRTQSDALATRIRAHLGEHGWGLWAVEVTRGRPAPFIGFVGLARQTFEAPFTPCVEVGWRLAHAHWGHGYATEAAVAALRFAFVSLALPEVVSMTSALNEPSRRVMERLGMRRDPTDDFEHPRVPPGSPLRPHVLHRIDARALEAAHPADAPARAPAL